MPRSWYDPHHAAKIEDPGEREFYLSIMADKKPYFMCYIYPDLMRKYKTYMDSVNCKALREFGKTLDGLLNSDELTDTEATFISYYYKMMPVSNGNCVVNRICRKFEAAFDGYVRKMRQTSAPFDWSIMKGDAEYTSRQYYQINKLRTEYNARLKSYKVFAARERQDAVETLVQLERMQEEFRASCDEVCSESAVLCEILLDSCYQSEGTKKFVWDMCSEDIVRNLLARNGGVLKYPARAEDGDIWYAGMSFEMREIKIEEEVEDEHCTE